MGTRRTNGLYIFTHNGVFAPSTASRIGLSGTFTSPQSAKGQFSIDVTVAGSTGEDEQENNKDSDILEYNNL